VESCSLWPPHLASDREVVNEACDSSTIVTDWNSNGRLAASHAGAKQSGNLLVALRSAATAHEGRVVRQTKSDHLFHLAKIIDFIARAFKRDSM
jgi:hypothetical protein